MQCNLCFFIGSSGISRFLIQVLQFQRPSAKELIKHRFIKNARKSPKLLERIRFDAFSLQQLWHVVSIMTLSWFDIVSKVTIRCFSHMFVLIFYIQKKIQNKHDCYSVLFSSLKRAAKVPSKRR